MADREPPSDPADDDVPRTDESRERSARLVDEGAGLSDTEKDEVAELGEDDDDEDLSAEEAAMRIEDDPKGLADGPDRYVEEPGTP